ncbi:MAG: hypothetical protein J3Q66DRAFT_366591 [Benniella sp.]|nr:MAG: hypothetical protein J3Q66DRAFT_366591 [Benniella sp.]
MVRRKQPRTENLLVPDAPSYEQGIRAKALQHSFDYARSLYASQYGPRVEVAVVPATDGGSQTPLECFTNERLQRNGLSYPSTGLEGPCCTPWTKLLDSLLSLLPKSNTTGNVQASSQIQGNALPDEMTALQTAKFISLNDTAKTDSPILSNFTTTADFGRSDDLFLEPWSRRSPRQLISHNWSNGFTRKVFAA